MKSKQKTNQRNEKQLKSRKKISKTKIDFLNIFNKIEKLRGLKS
jgi:hypothetical protein